MIEMHEADRDGAFVNWDSHEFVPAAILPTHARSIWLAPSELQISCSSNDQATFMQRGKQELLKNVCMDQRK